MSTTQLRDRSTTPLRDADADLLLRLRIALSIHKRAGWHLVRFTAINGVVHLAGVVPTFYDRQLIASLVRHVAGVFGIEDKLTVGNPSIRQQVIDDETIPLHSDPAKKVVATRDPFVHLPVLSQTLDDVFVGPGASASHVA